jgi:hybrid cluster-associated redox disulfide protein
MRIREPTASVPQIEPAWTVHEVMRHQPSVIRVFLDLRMRCVGCPIAQFHTVEEAARAHGVDRADLLAALRAHAI